MTSGFTSTRAVAVYCGSSVGKYKAFYRAAESLGHALAANHRPLVYGGGSKGIMGVVSWAALKGGGQVTGVLPHAMVAAGGEKEKTSAGVSLMVNLNEEGREKVHTIVVNSMHERKVEMAKRVEAFFGLPGGYGTFEEVLEVTTWTQLGIHNKPVILLNVLSFWEPLRALIKSSVEAGFIRPDNESLIIFVDGPESHDEHEEFDWGNAAIRALDERETNSNSVPLYDWSQTKEGINKEGKWAGT